MRYLAVICVMLASLSGALAQMTPEETVVRTAYAKFAYAAEQYQMTQIATESLGTVVGALKPNNTMTNDQRLAAAQVVFVLNDFVIGNMQDIMKSKLTDFISVSNREILVAGARWYQVAEGGVMVKVKSIEPQWRPAPVFEDEGGATKALTFANGISNTVPGHSPAVVWQRYASYSVTVTFQGKSYGPYKAVFLFGHDANGLEMIQPHDTITDANALAFALEDHLFPDAFVSSHLRNAPVVANWLNAKIVSNQSCATGQGNLCCDLVKMQCGLAREDLTQGLAKALPPE
jgi:hypothetical protein